ncbi:unnamed protein product [Periconia digitata]|uniref:Uncharacterized protein n=1 Tax=Periconia digitata TaxID=1303443 RepID=A0A9W4UPT7_9PLEO|nr:unnamed protein product [Periconia digitata]
MPKLLKPTRSTTPPYLAIARILAYHPLAIQLHPDNSSTRPQNHPMQSAHPSSTMDGSPRTQDANIAPSLQYAIMRAWINLTRQDDPRRYCMTMLVLILQILRVDISEIEELNSSLEQVGLLDFPDLICHEIVKYTSIERPVADTAVLIRIERSVWRSAWRDLCLTASEVVAGREGTGDPDSQSSAGGPDIGMTNEGRRWLHRSMEVPVSDEEIIERLSKKTNKLEKDVAREKMYSERLEKTLHDAIDKLGPRIVLVLVAAGAIWYAGWRFLVRLFYG